MTRDDDPLEAFVARGRAAQQAVDQALRPVVLRLRYRVLGGHVHCRLFVGPALNVTLAKSGDLTFSLEEWPSVQARLASAVTIVAEDD